MKFGLVRATLVGTVIAWIIPVLPSGPWAVTSYPPAVESAPGFMILGTDTLRLNAGAGRDYFPQVLGSPCGGGLRDHDLRLVISVGPEPSGITPPALDSIWLVHRTGTVVDDGPVWSSNYGLQQVRYEMMPVWADGDSFTVLVAARGLSGGQRYMAVPVRIIAAL